MSETPVWVGGPRGAREATTSVIPKGSGKKSSGPSESEIIIDGVLRNPERNIRYKLRRGRHVAAAVFVHIITRAAQEMTHSNTEVESTACNKRRVVCI